MVGHKKLLLSFFFLKSLACEKERLTHGQQGRVQEGHVDGQGRGFAVGDRGGAGEKKGEREVG